MANRFIHRYHGSVGNAHHNSNRSQSMAVHGCRSADRARGHRPRICRVVWVQLVKLKGQMMNTAGIIWTILLILNNLPNTFGTFDSEEGCQKAAEAIKTQRRDALVVCLQERLYQ